ncbi:MAG: galactose-1-phosphate uridylyltransferase [Candidatus Rokubacteria bacterium]|nr:galactose-1-phosphate uridylyltransferase [Candidatus Rokubacteria bacterium]
MPELRKDPVVGRWVIISTERARRPTDFAPVSAPAKGGPCVFCAGQESSTPDEIWALRPDGSSPNKPGWTLRVVPNKFPALRIEGALEPSGEGLYDRMSGVGAHEVIIESPEHSASLAELAPEHVADVLRAYRDRILDLRRDLRLEHVMVFKNHGEAAGASLGHTHSQLIATPIVPIMVEEELEGALRHYRIKKRCIWCDILQQERREPPGRIVLEEDGFAALAPFAPRFPFETWILPARHRSSYEETSPDELRPLARLFREILRRMNRVLGDPPYNVTLHSAPLRSPMLDHYHWHLELIPKLTRIAGFEWGSGFFINPTPPEEAAKYLREAAERASSASDTAP